MPTSCHPEYLSLGEYYSQYYQDLLYDQGYCNTVLTTLTQLQPQQNNNNNNNIYFRTNIDNHTNNITSIHIL